MGTNAKLSQRIRAMLALPDDDTSCDEEVQRLSSWYEARLARYGEQAATVFLFNEVRKRLDKSVLKSSIGTPVCQIGHQVGQVTCGFTIAGFSSSEQPAARISVSSSLAQGLR